MSDTERVFALYVQVNPVPDPDLLPATKAEAELPAIEGSPIMDTREITDTRERTEVRPPQRVRRWKPAAVAAIAFVVVLGVVGGALMLRGDGNDEPVAAADARPQITCDGESCTYQGPTLIAAGTVEFTLVNNGPHEITLAVWKMYVQEALDEELERTPVVTDMALAPGDPFPDGGLWMQTAAPSGQTRTASPYMTSGTHLIDVVTATDGETDHVWRVAAIEVTAP